MFQGSHFISVDPKGRLTIPTRVREELAGLCGGRVVMTANSEDRCLLLYTEPDWQPIMKQISALPDFDPRCKRIKRMKIGNSHPLELDGNGRLLVPPTLRDYAEVDKKVVLVGQTNKFEIWSEERWAEQMQSEAEGELPPEVLKLSI